MKIRHLPNRNNDNLPNIGFNIACARISTGLSQSELSLLLGFKGNTAVCQYEKGNRTPNPYILWKIAQITKRPIQFFYT